MDGVQAIHFLARKQRAHSGFDLNQICAQASENPVLKELGKHTSRRNPSPQPFADTLDSGPECKRAIEEMKKLGLLGAKVRDSIDSCRARMREGFRYRYESWYKQSGNAKGPRILIVIHGFSTAVREVLKWEISDPEKRGIDVFVIRSEGEGALDSKLMSNTLLENPRERLFDNITIGDESTLVAFLDDSASVMVVLGAEAFDGKRMVHPWGIDFDDLRQKLTRRQLPYIVMVGEGYKFSPDLLATPQFYRHHLDRIKLSSLDSVFPRIRIENIRFCDSLTKLGANTIPRDSLGHTVCFGRASRGRTAVE